MLKFNKFHVLRDAVILITGVCLVCVAAYYYLCAVSHLGYLLGMGNWIFAILVPLTFYVESNGAKYTLIQHDGCRAMLNNMIFAACMTAYIFY